MAWLEKYRTAWEIFIGIVGAAIAWGILYNTVSDTQALAEKTSSVQQDNVQRITRLEERGAAIKESLDDIKQDLRGINQKLDRKD